MNHLAIDAATEVLSVALRFDTPSGPWRSSAIRDVGLRHTQRLMPLVDDLLAEAGLRAAELDVVSCTRGPGSFTGLRIGMATAKGLAVAIAGGHDLPEPPLISISTLDVLASRIAAPETLVLPVIDGRKGRFYAAAFRNGRRITNDLDLPAEQLLEAAVRACRPTGPADTSTDETPRTALVTGPHAARFAELATCAGVNVVVDPQARSGYALALLDLAAVRLPETGYDSIDQGPVYVRSSDAEIARNRG